MIDLSGLDCPSDRGRCGWRRGPCHDACTDADLNEIEKLIAVASEHLTRIATDARKSRDRCLL